MKNVKFKERLERAANAFFENENFTEQNSLAVPENQELAQISPAETADKYFTIFKRIFSFLPGVLFLHIVMPGLFTFGIGIWALFFLASGIFMVWAGLGDLKNTKHLWLPFSVMVVAFIFSLPFYFLGLTGVTYYIYAYIGILPLLFVAPILVKGWLDKAED